MRESERNGERERERKRKEWGRGGGMEGEGGEGEGASEGDRAEHVGGSPVRVSDSELRA